MYKKVLFSFLLSSALITATTPIADFSGVYQGTVNRIECPKDISELYTLVSNEKRISIAGGKYSMGGQIWCNNGVMIDMKHLNKVIAFDTVRKTVTVQTGMLWKDLQAFLQPHNFTVKVMQSYNDFSVGGSLSVNVHGRDPYSPLINTVESITVMLSDGSIVRANRTEHTDLFNAAIGGYGSCGIIIDATLQLEDNYKIKQSVTVVDVQDFKNFYDNTIANNPQVAFFNGNLYGPTFDKVVNFTWYKTDAPLTQNKPIFPSTRSFAHGAKTNFLTYSVASTAEYLMGEFASIQQSRFKVDAKEGKKSPVILRADEMNYTVKSLATRTLRTTKILQEYFIPVRHFTHFVNGFKKIIQEHDIKILNLSIRHVPRHNESILTYAPQDCFAFVCYISIKNNPQGHEQTQIWTEKVIDLALSLRGTYYLPYHLFATQDQFKRAYPRYNELLQVKRRYDPLGKFQNKLLESFTQGK